MADTTRFAPSPSGLLHLGHAYAACFAAVRGERFHVRIEDLDTARCVPEFEAAIFEDLAWLGLRWERPVMRQSERSSAYAAALNTLAEQDLLYPCFCARKRLRDEAARSAGAPHAGEHTPYDGLCATLSAEDRRRRLGSGAPHTLRLRAAEALRRTGPLRWFDEAKGWQEVNPALLGDVILARKDAACAYHLAVTVDDAAQEITLVTRGEDLFDSTHTHRLLQALLGLPEPRWHHHRLITDEHGRRLAKRDLSRELRALRLAGTDGEEITRAFAKQDSTP